MANRGAALLALGALVGCVGDYSASTGEMGRIEYGLHTDYEMSGGLTDMAILTGHAQHINARLTRAGERDADEPWGITHEVTPGEGVTIELDEEDEGGGIPGFDVTVAEAGEYAIESYYDGELFDRIELSFGAPSSLEVIAWIRPPGEEEFTDSSDAAAIDVEEGAQIALLPIPYAASGDRLAGDLTVAYSHTPEWAAVNGYTMLGVYEDEGVPGSVNSQSLIFVEPADVTVSIVDEANGITAERVFSVSPISTGN